MKKFIVLVVNLWLLAAIGWAQQHNYFGILNPGMGGQMRNPETGQFEYIPSNWAEAQACNTTIWRPSLPDYQGRPYWNDSLWLAQENEIRNAAKAGIQPYFVIEVSPQVRTSSNSCYLRKEFLDPSPGYTFEKFLADALPRLAPYCSRIKIIQAGNEPQSYAEDDLASYIWFMQRFYRTVKKIDPTWQVACGASSDGAQGTPYMLAFLEASPIQAFDRFDIHTYGSAFGDYWQIMDKFKAVEKILRQKGWHAAIDFTENSAFTADAWGWTYQTEEMQAADNLKRVIVCLSLGVDRVIQGMGLKESPLASPQGNCWPYDWSTYGLIFDGVGRGDRGDGIRKLGFYTFGIVSEKLSCADFIKCDNPAKNVYRFTFRLATGKLIQVLWYDQIRYAASIVTVSLGIYWPCTITQAITDLNGRRTVQDFPFKKKLKLTLQAFHPIFIEQK